MNQLDQAAIQEVNRSFVEAFGRGDFDAVAAAYTEDACLMPPGFPTVGGREAIGQFWAGGAEAMGLKAINLTTRELDIQGGTAQELGQYQIFGSEGLLDQGTYLVVWKQGSEGVWRLHWDIWNTDQAPPG